MDSRINNMGEESSKFVTFRKEKLRLIGLQNVPQPPKEKFDDSSVAEIKKALELERDQILKTIVNQAFGEIRDSYSLAELRAVIKKKSRSYGAKLAELDALIATPQRLEELIIEQDYSVRLGQWTHRTDGLNQSLATMEAQLPKPFSPSLINTEKFPDGSFRFPLNDSEEDSRVFQLPDGRWCDRWLQKGLGEKKAIPLTPWEKYTPYLERYTPEVYVPAHKKDQEARNPHVAPVVDPPPPQHDVSPEMLNEFYRMGDPPESNFKQRNPILYGGGNKR